jgi:hypothetical protein
MEAKKKEEVAAAAAAGAAAVAALQATFDAARDRAARELQVRMLVVDALLAPTPT